jgi:cobalt-zinc-cadmium efflux system outer membrane protein
VFTSSIGRIVGQRRSLWSIAFVVLGLGTRPAFADDHAPALSSPSPPTKVDVGTLLRDHGALVTWVRSHDGEVAASIARIRQAEADVSTSRLLPNPILDATLSDIVLGNSNPTGLGFSDTAVYSVGISETIELAKRGPRGRAADLRARSAMFSSSNTLATRVAEARRALGRVVYLNAKQAILQAQLEAAKSVTSLERVRLDQGAISGNDFDRLVLDNTSLEVDLWRNQADVDGAMANCRAALYAACEMPGATLADLEQAASIPPALPGAAAALEQRADLKALALESDAARQDAILAARRAVPDPAIRVGYTRDNLLISGDQGNTLSVGLTLPLPIFDHGQHDSTRALARALELEHTKEATLLSASADVEELASRRAILEKGLAALEKEAVPRSESILATTNKAFDQGQVSLTDLLIARRTHISLLLGVLDLKFDFFSVRSELRRVLGLDVTDAGSP